MAAQKPGKRPARPTAARKANAARSSRRVDAGAARSTASLARLPAQAAAIVRQISTDPLRIRVGASDTACQHCRRSCDKLPVPIRSNCLRLCAPICGG